MCRCHFLNVNYLGLLMYKQFVAALVVLFSLPAFAENQIGFLIGGGLTSGGDDIASFDVQYDDGDSGQEDLKAGEFVHLYTGFYLRHGAADGVKYGAQFSVGYFFDGLFAENGDASFSRIPIEGIGFVEYKWLRFGGGLTKHNKVELEVDADLGFDGTIQFEDAVGLVGIIEYLVTPKFSIGLRFVDIEYELEASPSDEKFDGTHVGLTLNGLF